MVDLETLKLKTLIKEFPGIAIFRELDDMNGPACYVLADASRLTEIELINFGIDNFVILQDVFGIYPAKGIYVPKFPHRGPSASKLKVKDIAVDDKVIKVPEGCISRKLSYKLRSSGFNTLGDLTKLNARELVGLNDKGFKLDDVNKIVDVVNFYQLKFVDEPPCVEQNIEKK